METLKALESLKTMKPTISLKTLNSLIAGQRYTFYEKKNLKNLIIIFEAEFIDIIKGVYDTIRVCKYQYIADNLIYYGEMNNGMLTTPADWIDKVVYKEDNDLLKQITLMI
jgi:hypothetical protein